MRQPIILVFPGPARHNRKKGEVHFGRVTQGGARASLAQGYHHDDPNFSLARSARKLANVQPQASRAYDSRLQPERQPALSGAIWSAPPKCGNLLAYRMPI